MDVDAVVGAFADSRLARVHAHPHAQLDPLRPRVPGDRTLSLDEGLGATTRIRKDDEELVAAMVDDVAAAALHRLAKESPVVGEHERPRVAELAHELCRAFDIGEDECDRSIGQIGCQSLLQWYLGPDSGSGAGGTMDLKLAA